MDFITRLLDRKIKFFETENNFASQKIYSQARFEFTLVYLLGYLWNKNIEKLESNSKEYIVSQICRPTIGDIVSISRSLDIDKEIFKSKLFNKSINSYPKIRNEKIGHGFTFEDGDKELIKNIKELYTNLFKSEINILNQKIDFVQVERFENGIYKGIRYSNNGADYFPWQAPKEVTSFILDSLYALDPDGNYFRLSPFVVINSENEIYIYTSIEETLTGRIKYNQLLKSGIFFKEWEEVFNLNISVDTDKRKSRNGTVLNTYRNNYQKYIDIGIKKEIKEFLTQNNSSVYGTIWGHGGVGKTAAIQSCCEDLANQVQKVFDYIVFLSAKDRYYDYYKGKIIEISDSIDSLSGIIQTINSIIFNEVTTDIDKIFSFEGRVLIVIDDFETFSEEEQKKILEFINKLDINHHKVILTTRAAKLIRGIEIVTNSFSQDQTITFLLDVVKNQFPGINIEHLEHEISSTNSKSKIYSITSGRPLFIYQLGILVGQKCTIKESLEFDIKSSETAIDFLYGRIYNYLSPSAKRLFVTMSLITTENELTNLVNRLRFIVDMENDEEKFSNSVNELVKLKIIEITENDFFRIYSPEILKKMKEYFEKEDDIITNNLRTRLQRVSAFKDLDTEIALLKNADSSRISKEAEKVIENYEEILSRPTADEEIKLTAFLHYVHYLYNDIGKKLKAKKLFEEYEPQFRKHGLFYNRYAHYCWLDNNKDSKSKAVNILSQYFKNKKDFSDDLNKELFGQLVQYRSMLAIYDREELKSKRQLGEISEKEFAHEYNTQKSNMITLHNNLGVRLFVAFKKENPDEILPKLRQQYLIALYQFTEICIRLKKYKIANEICDFVIDNYNSVFSSQFVNKYNKIKRYTIRDLHRGLIR